MILLALTMAAILLKFPKKKQIPHFSQKARSRSASLGARSRLITPDNRETVFADIEAAPFTLDKISAFTGTQPQPAEFYADLHQQGIVAIQGLFGTQEAFNNTPIDNLNNEQRESLFTSVYADGGDIIASDYYRQNAQIIGYPGKNEMSDSLEATYFRQF